MAETITNAQKLRLGGTVTNFTGTSQHRKTSEQDRLREIEERYNSLFICNPDPAYVLDFDGRFLSVNPAFERVIGYSLDELNSKPFQFMLLGEERNRWVEHFTRVSQGKADRIELVVLGSKGQQLVMDITDIPVFSRDRTTSIQGVARDISIQKQFQARLLELAERDPLTNFLNRRRFKEELEQQLAQSKRYATHGSLLFIDVDNLKHINDGFGHNSGDQLLMRLAAVLRFRLRKTDIVGRIGGDEFAVILPHTSAAEAQMVAQSLLECLENQPLVLGGKEVPITASIGIATYPDHGTTVEDILIHADMAMYQVKGKGRDGICVYTPGQDSQFGSSCVWNAG